jgi:hypothetical protein
MPEANKRKPPSVYRDYPEEYSPDGSPYNVKKGYG